jgi:hypothetical protein
MSEEHEISSETGKHVIGMYIPIKIEIKISAFRAFSFSSQCIKADKV